MGMPGLQRYNWNLCLIKYELDINVFVPINCSFSFSVSLRKWLAHFLFIRNNGESQKNINFSSQKTKVSSTCSRHCKSGLAIFLWRIINDKNVYLNIDIWMVPILLLERSICFSLGLSRNRSGGRAVRSLSLISISSSSWSPWKADLSRAWSRFPLALILRSRGALPSSSPQGLLGFD